MWNLFKEVQVLEQLLIHSKIEGEGTEMSCCTPALLYTQPPHQQRSSIRWCIFYNQWWTYRDKSLSPRVHRLTLRDCPFAGLGPMYGQVYLPRWWPKLFCCLKSPPTPPIHLHPHVYSPVLGAGLHFTTLPCPQPCLKSFSIHFQGPALSSVIIGWPS